MKLKFFLCHFNANCLSSERRAMKDIGALSAASATILNNFKLFVIQNKQVVFVS